MPLWMKESTNLKWLEELLRRSHPLPISYTISTSDATSPSVGRYKMQLYHQHVERVKHLILSTYIVDSAVLKDLTPISKMPLGLESLEIYNKGLALEYGGEVHKCSRLKKLTLSRTPFPPLMFQSPSFSTIRFLNIAMPGEHFDNLRPTAREWLGILQQLSSLEDLSILEAIGPTLTDGPSFSVSQIVAVRHLRSLNISEPIEEIATLLDSITFPGDCSVDISAQDVFPGTSLDSVLSIFNQRLVTSSSDKFQYPWHFFLDWAEMVLQSGGPARTFRCGFYWNTDDVDGSMISLSLLNVLRSHLACIPRVKIDISDMVFNYDAFHPTLREVFQSFSGVHGLDLDPLDFPFFLLMEDSQPGGMLLPLLTKVSILKQRLKVDQPSRYASCEDYIRWRSRVGHPITEVVIEECQEAQDMVGQLRAIDGLAVLWDGLALPRPTYHDFEIE